jgi:hypothetical protein
MLCGSTPVCSKPSQLRASAYQTAWIAITAEAASDLEYVLDDVPPEGHLLPGFSPRAVKL